MRRKTVVRSAARLSALLLLVGALVPLAQAEVLTTGVVSTGNHVVSVDSALLMDPVGGFSTYQTAGWGGDSMVTDSFVFVPPMLGAPTMMIILWLNQDGIPAQLDIPMAVQDSWYLIPGAPTQAQVKFFWKDTIWQGIDERGRVEHARVGLTVSPSIVGTGATIRAERVAGTSCAFTFYDAAGNLVRTLRAQASASGTATATWNGTDDFGRRLAEGIYYCSLEDAANTAVRKVLLTR